MVGKSDKEPTPTVRQPFDYPITQTVPELILPNSPPVLFRAKLPPKYKVLVTIYNCTRVQSLTSNFVFYILIGQIARELEPNSHSRTCYTIQACRTKKAMSVPVGITVRLLSLLLMLISVSGVVSSRVRCNSTGGGSCSLVQVGGQSSTNVSCCALYY